MTTCVRAHDGAPYVLGALSPDERLSYEAHLESCAECRASVREVAGLPGLLARVSATDAADVSPSDPAPA
ncbi:MAG TPA: zf-HC2 domain-containing protein, partial [Cryptosporangiaceae bacterium]|nr:zf-HC2 domain-containing protein [Cryptosporangiaceae bacterium]